MKIYCEFFFDGMSLNWSIFDFACLHFHYYRISQLNAGPRLKGHTQLWDRADLDTSFLILKKVRLNLKSKYI